MYEEKFLLTQRKIFTIFIIIFVTIIEQWQIMIFFLYIIIYVISQENELVSTVKNLKTK